MTLSASIDARHMARALMLARKGLYTTDPNPRVGCVIVNDSGHIVGEGWHYKAGHGHAEVLALQQAGNAARGARAYVTLEPCSHFGRTPPCADALINAGIRSVVCAMQDPNPKVAGSGLERLRQAGVEVIVGLMQAEAESLNIGFVARMRRQRAFVRVKLAQSLDGRSAMASGESQWITSAAARMDVHRLRARSSAIITGIGSVLLDDPRMTARLDQSALEIVQPKRVVLDSRLRLPPAAKILDEPGTIVYCSSDPRILDEPGYQQKALPLSQRQAEVRRIGNLGNLGNLGNEGLDLSAVIEDLTRRDECNEVLVEAGATLSGAMLQRDLVDELWIYMAPSLMGSSARPAFQLALQRMDEKRQWRYRDTRFFGEDLRIRLLPQA